MDMNVKIAYIMSRFPHLPEVFILREMIELERQGWQIELFPLISQEQQVVHDETEYWIRKAHDTPLLSFSICKDNLSTFIGSPNKYLSVLIRIVTENITSPHLLIRALVIFPKAVCMARSLKALGVSYIHAHYATHPALVAWIINRLTGIPYGITVHAHDIFVHTAMLKAKVRSAKFVASISKFNREHIASMLGEWVLDKIPIVHCGIDPSNYEPKFNEWKVGDCFELMTIGSLQEYKGYPTMIRACKMLKSKGVPFCYNIIGGGEDFKKLSEEIVDNDLESNIKLLGPKTQGQICELLQKPHCYIQPSIITSTGKKEGIPVALMEAMASCLPVIASNISGIPELVKDGKTGYLIQQGDSEGLAKCIESVYYNRNHAKQMAENAYQHLINEFTLVDNVRKLSGYMNGAIFQ